MVAAPKSPSRACPEESMSMLCAYRSPCAMPREWRCVAAAAIPRRIDLHFSIPKTVLGVNASRVQLSNVGGRPRLV